MAKDRLADFKAAIPNDEDDEEKQFVVVNVESSSFMEAFFEEVEQITKWVKIIEEDTEEFRKKQVIILTAPHTDKQTEDEIDDIMANIKRLSNKVKIKLKDIDKSIKEQEETNRMTADLRIRKTQHSTLCRKFVEIMTNYNTIQVDCREQYKDRIKRQLVITDNEKTDEELEQMIEKGDMQIFTQNIMTDSVQAKQTVEQLEARHNDIMKIEKSIRELHEMFMDLAFMVASQGELIDRIEFNVLNTVDYTESGKKKLISAASYMSASRKTKCICLVVLLVILAIIGLIVGLKYANNDDD